MSNLTECAFPAQETPGPNTSFSAGLTKHEYAAILMAQGLLSNYDHLPNADERDTISSIAYELAQNVLSYFK